MKQYIFQALLLLFGNSVFCQEVMKLQNGAVLSLEPGAVLTVNGSVTLEPGSTISNSGIFTIRQNGTSGSADFIDNTIAAYSYGPGKFVFNSNVLQTVYSNNRFGRIDVDNGGLLLSCNITAAKWWLSRGIVTTGDYAAIVTGTASTDVEAAPSNGNFVNSFISGKIRRYLNIPAENSYNFPIADHGYKRFVRLDNLAASPLTGIQYLTVSFGPKPGTDAGLLVTENGKQYAVVNQAGVWQLEADNTPASGNYVLQLTTDGLSGLTDNAFAILQRPLLSADAAEWTVPAGSFMNPVNGAGRLVADGYALRNNLPVFGQFGIGQLFGALPVTLSNFDARRITKLNVQLNWETQTESNNKGFAIERRMENENSFSLLGFVNSKATNGNSNNLLAYEFNDNNGYTGISYYRLKQVDLDDRGYYSLIKAVRGNGGNTVTVLLWPNPAKGQFSIRLDGTIGTKQALVSDALGKIVRRITITGGQQADVSGLGAGTYIILIPGAFGTNENFKQKVIVIK